MKLAFGLVLFPVLACAAELIEHSNQVIQHQNTTLTFDVNSSLQDVDGAWTVGWDKLQDLADGTNGGTVSTNDYVATSGGAATNLLSFKPTIRFTGTASPAFSDTLGDVRFVGGNSVGYNDYLLLKNKHYLGIPWPVLLNTNLAAAMFPGDAQPEQILTVTNADARYGLPSPFMRGLLAATNANIVVNAIGLRPTEYDVGDSGASKTIDWVNGIRQKVTLTSATVTLAFTGAPTNTAVLQLKVVQDGQGSRLITTGTPIMWANGVIPIPTSSTGAVDIVTVYWDGASYYANMTKNFR